MKPKIQLEKDQVNISDIESRMDIIVGKNILKDYFWGEEYDYFAQQGTQEPTDNNKGQ